MRLRKLALLACLLVAAAISPAVHASETPTEHKANIAAAQEKAAAPVHGDLPDYSLSPEKLAKAQHLEVTGVWMNFASTFWSIAQIVLLLWLGGIAWMRDKAVMAGRKHGLQLLAFPFELLVCAVVIDLIPAVLCAALFARHLQGMLIAEFVCLLLAFAAVIVKQRWFRQFAYRWVEGFTFFLLLLIAGFLLDLPLHLYGHHLGLSYGLSIQGWGSWLLDRIKSLTLAWVFGGLIVMLLFWVIRKFPRRWWLVFWGFSIPITLIGVFVSPFFGPVFNTYEPLAKSNAALVAKIGEVVERGHMDIPPERMFMMKASAKTTTLNADVEGFGSSKRVVVWDNTLDKMTADEVLFTFGHESGHYVLGHIVSGVYISIGITFFTLFLAYGYLNWAVRRFGAQWGVPSAADLAALGVLVLGVGIYGVISEPITNTLIRIHEHDADVYGQEAIHGIVADPQASARGAFQVLGETSFDDPNPPLLLEYWLDNHPSVGRRAAFAAHYDPWAPGEEPKYFKK